GRFAILRVEPVNLLIYLVILQRWFIKMQAMLAALLAVSADSQSKPANHQSSFRWNGGKILPNNFKSS
ncbi:MAG: hypothetical protein IK068_05145, partial [Lachnospiraceae bacterium]|nr:hypothetical protein [Lachnospiraceae bacterium]